MNKKTILVTGMRRSGSTLLYNIIKELIKVNGYSLYNPSSVNNYDDYDPNNDSDYHLLKVHIFEDKWLKYSPTIFNTKRDLRYVMSSEKRFNHPTPITNNNFIDRCLLNIDLYESWLPYSNFDFRYEDYESNPIDMVKTIAKYLDFGIDYPQLLLDKINNNYEEIKNKQLGRSMDGNTFMFSNHRTNINNEHFGDILNDFELNSMKNHGTINKWLNDNNYI